MRRSEEKRFVADVGNVKPVRDDAGQIDGVEVDFTGEVGEKPPENVFQQVVISIGQDPTRHGGPINLTKNLVQPGDEKFMLPIYENEQDPRMSPPPRPLGIQTADGRVRLMGAAADSADRAVLSGEDLAFFTELHQHHLESLPPETRVPIGITVAGIMIHRANQGGPEACIVNINTDSLEELMRLDDDFDDVAQEIIEYRTDDKHPSGFTDVEQLKNLDSMDEERFERIKDMVRI